MSRGGKGAARANILNAPSAGNRGPRHTEVPGWELSSKGLFKEHAARSGKPVPSSYLASSFEVLARTRDGEGNRHGLLLRWEDADSVAKHLVAPRAWLQGEARELLTKLADGGLWISPLPQAQRWFVEFLAHQRPTRKILSHPQPGWVFPLAGGAAFLLPGRTFGHIPGEEALLDMDPPPQVFRQRGDLAGWQRDVAALARGNRLLMFCISASFASALLDPLNEDGGGFNLFGPSRKGKSTCLEVAAATWGAPRGRHQFIRSWDTSPAGLEAVCAEHTGTAGIFDEGGAGDPHRMATAIYTMAGGNGRGRATAMGRTRHTATWLLIWLSSAELTFEDLLAAGGHQMTAGQAARLVDLPALAPGGHGVFEVLHGNAGGGELAEALKRAAAEQHGTAGPAFLDWLAPRVAADTAWPSCALAPRLDSFASEFLPPGADGQVRNVCRRFALVALAGELATEAGVTGWPKGSVWEAGAWCFEAWLARRGSVAAGEDLAAVERVRAMVAAQQNNRFILIGREPDVATVEAQLADPPPERRAVVNAVGWKKWHPDKAAPGGGYWHFLFSAPGWRETVGTLDPVAAARALERRCLLLPGKNHPSRTAKVPGFPNGVKVYEVRGAILAGDEDEA